MKIQLLSTLKKYKKDYLKQDIFSGIIIAAVSIPISMGYAQIAGLPPAYGLYGSILPILLFAIFSTSKQFIFGVDAAPAALAGSALLSLGIVPGSEAALNYIPILALFTGLWLLFFYIINIVKGNIFPILHKNIACIMISLVIKVQLQSGETVKRIKEERHILHIFPGTFAGQLRPEMGFNVRLFLITQRSEA